MMRSTCALGLLGKISAFGLMLAVAGCAPVITTEGGAGEGEDDEGGGDEGGDDEGGSDICPMYTGDGCTPGETRPSNACGDDDLGISFYDTCERDYDSACNTYWVSDDCETPLVLSFDGAEPELVADSQHGFVLTAGLSRLTDWPTAKTPWLALDRDGSGAIEDGAELFGSMSPLAGGGRAPNGFAALSELDADRDGVLSAADPAFSRLLLWADRDGDRASSPSELSPLGAWGIFALDLGYAREPRCDARGNCGVERAPFRFVSAAGERTGTIIDVHFTPQR